MALHGTPRCPRTRGSPGAAASAARGGARTRCASGRAARQDAPRRTYSRGHRGSPEKGSGKQPPVQH
eukprot:4947056-Alexandrium_andersonii.AAC.1